MNEHLWRTYKTVAETRSISQAARFLNLSQSAVSQHIHQMESEYGTPLFVRTSQGVSLTDTGELVYRYVTLMLKTLNESREAVKERLQQQPTTFTLGASLTIAEYLLPYVLPRIEKVLGKTHLTVFMANSWDIADRVRHGEMDLGLVEAPISVPQLTVRPFLDDHLRVVVGPRHPWFERTSVHLEELLDAPFIVREPGSGTRWVLEDALNQVGIGLNQLNIRFVLGTTQAIKTMIIQDVAVSIMSPYTILPYERHLFRLLPVEELPMYRNFSLVYPNELSHSTALRLIHTLVTVPWAEILEQPSPPPLQPDTV
ncbi:transcriptional regulator, LysR family [Sulfobacillus acidophilus TPY]|uniref:Transcriptional regulator, LysR family n=1 Tax=Sulfobacillus acidophilus (strain ATCC 700253 / DSM 10332 / NAL) TaxID=679936 RepID=G8TVN6_SULAD|nr:transcriptional regulator, LysR family [Sulfobacillus acidophilus TPY]AEW03675.1 transcriptional regulator, LysR family [Sulfobacillus acidophilus DSM 10332]MCY0864989.1 LysR family transcriptional regulator [Sulfobacillus sp.]